MIRNNCSQPRRDSRRSKLFQILTFEILQTCFQHSQSRTQQEEVILRNEVSRTRRKTCRLHRQSDPRKTPCLEYPQQKWIPIMSSMSHVQFTIQQTHIGVAILFLTVLLVHNSQQILQITNRSEVVNLTESELQFGQFLLFNADHVSSVHIPHLLEVVTSISPKYVIWILSNHEVDVIQLLIHETLNLLRRFSVAIEIQPAKINEGRINLTVGGIALEKSNSLVLIHLRSLLVRVYIQTVPSGLAIIDIEVGMGKLQLRNFVGDLVFVGERVQFGQGRNEHNNWQQKKDYHQDILQICSIAYAFDRNQHHARNNGYSAISIEAN